MSISCVVIIAEQGNWVRVPDGTAAVSAEFVLIDENQSLGKPEKAKNKREVKLRKRKSEDLQEEIH